MSTVPEPSLNTISTSVGNESQLDDETKNLKEKLAACEAEVSTLKKQVASRNSKIIKMHTNVANLEVINQELEEVLSADATTSTDSGHCEEVLVYSMFSTTEDNVSSKSINVEDFLIMFF